MSICEKQEIYTDRTTKRREETGIMNLILRKVSFLRTVKYLSGRKGALYPKHISSFFLFMTMRENNKFVSSNFFNTTKHFMHAYQLK